MYLYSFCSSFRNEGVLSDNKEYQKPYGKTYSIIYKTREAELALSDKRQILPREAAN